MTWSDAISEGLPSPRDDEPANLRQDLVDELNDHLQSALQRELRAVPDVEQARRNVLARFGDPRRVLYELWYQAMKEQIMSQRVMLIMGAVMVVACLAALAMTWMLLQQSQSTQAALLDKIAVLTTPQPATAPTPPTDWRAVKVRLVDEHDGPSANKLIVEGRLFGDTNTKFEIEGDADIDLGLLHVGNHFLTVVTSQGEKASRDLYLRPLRSERNSDGPFAHIGEEEQVTIRCPADLPEAELSFDVQWPEDLRVKSLMVACLLSVDERKTKGARKGESDTVWSPIWRLVVLNVQGQIVHVAYDDGAPVAYGFFRRGFGRSAASEDGSVKLSAEAVQFGVNLPPITLSEEQMVLKDLLWDHSATVEPSITLPAIKYKLRSLAVVLPGDKPEERARMLGFAPPGRSNNYGEIEPVPGQPNRVAVSLPDALLAQVRKNLAAPAEQSATAVPASATANPNPAEWSHVRVRLTLDDGHDSPRRGV